MKTYKGTDQNLKCRGFQYEIGKEFETDEAHFWASIFTAISEGKTIQYLKEGFVEVYTEWVDIEPGDIEIKRGAFLYRIKPVVEFIPFQWSDYNLFLNKEIEHKIMFNGSIWKCIGFDRESILIEIKVNEDEFDSRWESFETLFENYVFKDGGVFGKLKYLDITTKNEQLCVICGKKPSTFGIGKTKTVCSSECWNKFIS